MDLKPLGDRVLIKPDTPIEETASGLLLKQSWQPEQTGTVVAVGETSCGRCKALIPSDVKPGDAVVFSWQVGQEITVNHGEERYLLMRQSDILCVLEGAEA